uniref:MADF domain-containing protein n=1 Tax=Salarias fasciatus TaxID=181472 RepID=A0A672IEP5_SALFA
NALAELVRCYEHLYNPTSAGHKDTRMCNNLWAEIAQKMKMDENECRRRWRSLRDKFAKVKRRVIHKKSGAAGGTKAQPALFTSLRWLEKYIKQRPTATNMTILQDEVSTDSPNECRNNYVDMISSRPLLPVGGTLLQTTSGPHGRWKDVLHVADAMRSLPPHLLPECKLKITAEFSQYQP